ncbi:hypothetical protein Ahy_A02g006045 isoform C [Arachis hypogaea]|uniref:Uncharacterized protein n=1 Tax=Arachis hypogaea TaxID=3818 RepID=A0A445E8I2_ARAHY|nr:hypothetical protein Ahy_A02g006045 isoform C [Arachis hypogaea]
MEAEERERRGERRVTPSVVAAFPPPSPKLLGSPSMHPCCCCVAGASRRCTGRRRTQMRPLSSWVLIVASYSIVRRCRNRARFIGSSSVVNSAFWAIRLREIIGGNAIQFRNEEKRDSTHLIMRIANN